MTGQRIGYIRVSTFDQNPERQLEGVKVDRAFSDKASGKDVKRPQLEALISFARTGDTVVVHSMDRLARNLDDLRRIVQTLTQRGVHIEFVKEHLSFTGEDSPMANLMLSVRHCCKVSDEAAFCLIQRPYISKTLLTRRISPRGSP
ncbi:Tn21 resolvase [Salmonella enterica subsp. enterica serovar Agona str. ATCC BAA-707]|nr:Tn21 resolvase [Salmonella enterica subsp. enterica serovar Agona str. ATCC BAA-707]